MPPASPLTLGPSNSFSGTLSGSNAHGHGQVVVDYLHASGATDEALAAAFGIPLAAMAAIRASARADRAYEEQMAKAEALRVEALRRSGRSVYGRVVERAATWRAESQDLPYTRTLTDDELLALHNASVDSTDPQRTSEKVAARFGLPAWVLNSVRRRKDPLRPNQAPSAAPKAPKPAARRRLNDEKAPASIAKLLDSPVHYQHLRVDLESFQVTLEAFDYQTREYKRTPLETTLDRFGNPIVKAIGSDAAMKTFAPLEDWERHEWTYHISALVSNQEYVERDRAGEAASRGRCRFIIHEDGDLLNNSPENLLLVGIERARHEHLVITGKIPRDAQARSYVHRPKTEGALTLQDAADILDSRTSAQVEAMDRGVSVTTIEAVRTGKTWRDARYIAKNPPRRTALELPKYKQRHKATMAYRNLAKANDDGTYVVNQYGAELPIRTAADGHPYVVAHERVLVGRDTDNPHVEEMAVYLDVALLVAVQHGRQTGPEIEKRRYLVHKDGDKLNNRVANLEWVEHPPGFDHKRARRGVSTNLAVIAAVRAAPQESNRALAIKLDTTPITIAKIRRQIAQEPAPLRVNGVDVPPAVFAEIVRSYGLDTGGRPQ